MAILSPDELLQAVQQLSPAELSGFVEKILALRADREAPRLSQEESDLLLAINEPIPADLQSQYNTLIAKRQSETLTNPEHEELRQLTDEIERREADRIEALRRLAGVRGTSLQKVMADLGIQSADAQ
jgi:hypothetical protein